MNPGSRKPSPASRPNFAVDIQEPEGFFTEVHRRLAKGH
jgi:hypothetical protein